MFSFIFTKFRNQNGFLMGSIVQEVTKRNHERKTAIIFKLESYFLFLWKMKSNSQKKPTEKKKHVLKGWGFCWEPNIFFDLFLNYLEFSILCINMYQCSYVEKNGSLFMCILFRGWMREILGFGLKFYTQGICCHFILFYLPKKGLITEK